MNTLSPLSKWLTAFGIVAVLAPMTAAVVVPNDTTPARDLCKVVEGSTFVEKTDSAAFTELTEEQFQTVADRLGIEVATIKAVSDVEAGAQHKGFHAPFRPVINFDCTVFRITLTRKKFNVERLKKEYPEVFQRMEWRKYGSRERAQYSRLEIAARIDRRIAYESTFWGMFQIGGFNWKKCGCDSIKQFVELMSRSELDQLQLFANFLESENLVRHLKNKNWAAFARAYNGPKYASRRYHTRLDQAYRRHKAKEAKK